MANIENYDWDNISVDQEIAFATSLRDSNRFASYLLCRKILESKVLTPTQTTQVYTNLSIICYYIGKKDEGEKACIKLLSLDHNNLTYNNLKFYSKIERLEVAWRCALPHDLSHPLSFASLQQIENGYNIYVDGVKYFTEDPESLQFTRDKSTSCKPKMRMIDEDNAIIYFSDSMVYRNKNEEYTWAPYCLDCIPFKDHGDIYLLKIRNSPLVYRLENNKLVFHTSGSALKIDAGMYMLTSEPINYKDGWLVIVNIGPYIHRFIWFSKDWMDHKIGRLFYIDFELRPEEIYSMAAHKDGVLISYSTDGKCVNIVKVNRENIGL